MAVTHPNAVRQTICDYIVDKLDVGAAAAALIELDLANGTTEVATLTMTVKGTGAFGASNGSGVATAAAITADASATGNASPAVIARFLDCNGAEVFRCSVGSGSGDISLNSNVISAGQQVSITSLTYTAVP